MATSVPPALRSDLAAAAVLHEIGYGHVDTGFHPLDRARFLSADMTTGPRGQDVAVEDRLDEICARYGPDDLVTRFVTRARPMLVAAGQSPVGSIQVRC